MKILVTGATGFIGKKLCYELSKSHEVFALVRNIEKAKKQLPGVELIHWPKISASFELPKEKINDKLDVVINLMGESVAGGRWTEQRKKALYDSRIAGTKNLFKQLKEVKIGTVLQASAVGFYGNTEAREVNESSPVGDGFLAKICEHWENEAHLHNDQYERLCIFRLGVVLGEGGGALEKMLPAFKLGVAGKLGDGKQFMPWIHRDDVIGLFVTAMNDETWSGVYNATAPGIVDNERFTKVLGNVLNRPTILPAPAFALKLALGDMSKVILEGQGAVPERAIQQGHKFKFPELKEALTSIVS